MDKIELNENSFMSINEIQKCLQCSKTFAYDLVNQNDFPKIRIGRKILIPTLEFQRWIKHNMHKK